MFEKILQKNEELINYLYFFNKILIFFLASYISFKIRINQEQFYDYFKITVIFTTISIIIQNLFGKSARFYDKSMKSFIIKDIYFFVISILILIFLAAIFKVTDQYSRVWLFLFIFFTSLFLILHKIIYNWFYNSIISANIFTKNVLLIGEFESVKNLIKKLSKENRYHFRICIFIDKNPKKDYFPIQNIKLDENINDNINYYKISQIWIIQSDNFNSNNILEKLSATPIDIRTVYSNNFNKEHYVEKLESYNIYETSISPFYGINLLLKIFLDYFLGIIFFIISLPFIAVFGLLILIEDGRPIFFIQKRHGWDNHIINIYKLRSLKKNNSLEQVKEGDERVLKVGKFIRKFSIDELPQFINILKGEMSIVGPRPHALEHNNEFSQKIKGFMQRHRCKPGLTGLAQVKGFRGPTPLKEQMAKRFEQDILYIKKWNIFLDLYIILKTMIVFLFQKVD